jgi:proteasome lid subunit RPN8/RPN11
LSYVSICKPVNDRIAQVSLGSGNEVIGLLLGRLESDTMIIEDSITGDFEGEQNHVVLPANTLAKIADDMLNGRIKGNIVGWYHSHTESGLAFSETDIQTQKNLQQFSSLITAMVFDVKTGEVGYFRVDPQTGQPNRIPNANVTVFEESSEATKNLMKEETQMPPTSTVETSRPPIGRSAWPSTKVLTACIILAVAAGLIVIGLIFYRSLGGAIGTRILHSQIVRTTVR